MLLLLFVNFVNDRILSPLLELFNDEVELLIEELSVELDVDVSEPMLVL
jgi:hypothetical protein